MIKDFLESTNFNFSSPFLIVVISLAVLIIGLLILNEKFKIKYIKQIIIGLLGIAFIALIILYWNIMLAAFDIVLKVILQLLFFPSVAQVILTILLSIIILLLIVKKSVNRRWFNITNYIFLGLIIIMNIFLVSVLSAVGFDNIYDAYGNGILLKLMQINSFFFAFYLIAFYFMIFYIRTYKKQEEILRTKEGLEIVQL